jgi:hypothetical protein
MRAMMSGWLSSEILTASSIVRILPFVSSGVGKGRMPFGAGRYSRGSCCIVAGAPGMAPVPGGGWSGPVDGEMVMGGTGTLGMGVWVPGAVVGGGDGGAGREG